MEYCFIEKWEANYKLPENCKAVALTPNASYQLDKAGIEYVTFGDYFSSGEIRGDTENYLKSQVLWFEEFDQFVMKLFPGAEKLNVRLPSLYFHNIKYMVDCIILSSRILSRFIEIAKPSKIWFIPEIYGEDKIGRWEYFSFGESSFYRLAPLICKKDNIPFERLRFEDLASSSIDGSETSLSKAQKYENISAKEAIFARLRDVKRQILRYLCLFYRFKPVKDKKSANVFVVREFPYTNDFYKDSMKAGFGIYYKENESIYKLDWVVGRDQMTFENSKDTGPGNGVDFISAANDLAKSSIMKWVNEQCGIDVYPMLYSRFKFFLEEVFVETINRIKKYVEFYDKHKIDFVVSYAISTIDDYAATAAARASLATKTASFFHGVDALDFKSRYFSEYRHFDYFFVSTFGEVEHIKSLANLFHDKTIKVNEYSYFRDQFSERSKRRFNKRYTRNARPVVLYIPIMRVERMNMPIEKAQSLQWDYLKWHKTLIKYFSLRKDFHFIWKAILQYYDRGDTIADIINDTVASNITYSTANVRKWFPEAERAICDIPSTAFYECIFSKIPVFSMYRPDDQKLHKDAYLSYGLSLQPYSTVEEGISAIEKYLNNKADNYVVSLLSNNVFIPDLLCN